MLERSGLSLFMHIGQQGALLFSGFALSQGMSFARNAIIGHWLSRGDFGIAATLTLMLQLVEIISDAGVDRMVVQARDGDEPRFVSNAHSTMMMRGVVTSLVLYLLAGPVTSFFRIEDALYAFQMIAFVPLVKGFMHLDPRRYQRKLQNRAQMFVEVLPQALALLVCVPILTAFPDYQAIVWLSLGQAVCSVVLSHAVSERAYRWSLDGAFLRRWLAFCWPIWLSALPLVAVLQGDRILVGRVFGMDVLAGFSAAFMMTMVPGLIGAKVGQSLMLPLLSEMRDQKAGFMVRLSAMSDITVVVASMYLFSLVGVGGQILPLAFGANYYGLELVVAWLAVMWGVRMIQVGPGMGFMALGNTRPLLVAGAVRSLGLLAAIVAVVVGAGVVGVVFAGVCGEVASLIYLGWRMARDFPGAGTLLISRAAVLVPVAITGFAFLTLLPSDATFGFSFFLASFGTIVVGLGVTLVLPATRLAARQSLRYFANRCLENPTVALSE